MMASSGTTVGHMFAAQAARTPDRVAVVDHARSLTYAALDRLSDRWAAVLRRHHHVRPEVPVGLLMDRSIELVVACLAVLKAGGAYVPLDPDQPPGRLRTMLLDCAAQTILARREFLPTARSLGPSVVPVELDRGEPVESDDAPAVESDDDAPPPSDDNLAYIIFTSGSTGRPKGVQIEHRALANYLTWARAAYCDPDAGTVPLHSPPGFDFTVTNLLLPLISGGCVRVLSGYDALVDDPDDVSYRFVKLTPAHLALLGREGSPERLSRLTRLLVVGGEALFAAAFDPWPTGDRVEVVNEYGPTEATVGCCVYRAEIRSLSRGNVPIGRAIANMAMYLLDEDLDPVPPGEPGEIYIGGVGVARGYLGLPELTAERFLPDPFSREPGRRMYRTGDAARMLPDGNLEYLGRLDGQVKIRGYRIEPGEVEAAVLAHPDVAETAVLAREDRPEDRRLVAYFAPVPNRPAPDPGTLREHLRRLLPGYMVPSVFVALRRLPLTANGKVDRDALPRPPDRPEPAAAGEPPRNPTEVALARIWSAELAVANVGPDDSFVELGGHSLLANRILAEVEREFGVALPLRSMFDHPTLRGLAEAIARAGEIDAALRPPLRPRARPARVPLTFAQRRLWFLDQYGPGSDVYNVVAPLRVAGRVSETLLARAANAVVARHESLRTCFGSEEGEPYQIVRPPKDLPVRRHELEPGRPVADWIAACGAGAFDLSEGPLVRFDQLRLDGGEYILNLTAHHTVVDAWSAGLLHREIAAHYAALVRGVAPPPPDPVQLCDFALWQRDCLREDVRNELLGYWRDRLRGAPEMVTLPTDRPRPPIQRFAGATEWFTIPAGIVQRLRALCASSGTTLFTALVAAFLTLLSRQSGQPDVVVGVPVANRSRPETQKLVGFLIDTVALRLSLAGDPTVREILARARDATLGALAHQDLPFEMVVEALRPERDPAYQPIFQVFFNLLPPTGGPWTSAGLTWEPLVPPEISPKFDLNLYVWDGPGDLRCSLIYNVDLFSTPRMSSFARQYLEVVSGFCADPQRPVDTIVTTGTERLPDPRLDPPAVASSGRTVPAVAAAVAVNVRRLRDRLAVVGDRESWTYGELDLRADEMERQLRALGVGAGDAMAVLAGRSPWLAVALLAVLRRRATFALLDRHQPRARLDRLVAAIGPRVLLDVADHGTPRVCIAPAGPGAPRRSFPPDGGHVMFTSGSTGLPQGVVSGSWPLARFLQWHAETFGLSADDRFSVLSGLGHDPVLRDIFAGPYVGGQTHWPDSDVVREPGRLTVWLRDHEITICHLTPALLDGMEATAEAPVECVRYLFLGGEPLTGRHVAAAHRLAPGATIVNFYGATETPQAVGYRVLRPGDSVEDGQVVPIGTGAAEAQLLVCRGTRALCGVGELGEVAIRSRYLADGYLDPRDDAERFTANPFNDDPADRIFWSGDLGRYLPDGSVQLAGRHDRQINIRGFRIEPAEIEAALRRRGDVTDAAVLAVDRGKGPVLTAFVSTVHRGRLSTEQLSTALRLDLPEYLLPQRIVVVERLPRLANGKLDARALESMDPAVPMPTDDGVGTNDRLATDDIEAAIARLWQDLIGRPPAHRDQSFFEEGNSLLAVRMVVGLRRQLSVELPLRRLFESPTVSGLAAAIRGSMAT